MAKRSIAFRKKVEHMDGRPTETISRKVLVGEKVKCFSKDLYVSFLDAPYYFVATSDGYINMVHDLDVEIQNK